MVTPIGMVHGRFQPVHVEHFQYILRGLAQCSQLIVGITNPDPSDFSAEAASPHRHLDESNPYTFFQRSEMIKQCLIDEHVDLGRISLAPFHLHDPSKWRDYLPPPRVIVQYVRAFSEWEDQKIKLFEQHGFKVELLDYRAPKNVEGVQVRALKRSGGDWLTMVPPGAARVIERIEAGCL
jgi:nicotinamide mononucleotide adenylyltransferase